MFPLKFYILFFPVLVTLSRAQHNVTVNNTSPSISYEGEAEVSGICKVDSNGLVLGNQTSCWNVPSGCTLGVTMGLEEDINSEASFSFKGSAIYIESLLNSLSPIYTVTVDGQSTDIDGVRPSRAFICAPVFSKTGLDPNVEHKVRFSVKGPSPNRNMSVQDSEKYFVFSLVSYTFTASSSIPSRAATLYNFGGNAFVAAVMVAWSLLF